MTVSALASANDALLTLPEIAEYMRLSLTTVRRMHARHELPTFRSGKKIIVARRSSLDAMLAAAEAAAVQEVAW